MTITVEIEQSDVEQALATGLISMDASRRVGWAKAFEALRRIDSLEEEVRQLRDERKHLRRAYSRLLGFVQNIPTTKSPVFNREVQAHSTAERSFRHQDAYDKGVAVAVEHQIHIGCRTDEDLEQQREKRAARRQAYEKLFGDATALGHDIRRGATSSDTSVFVCSCGESFSGADREVADRRLDHAANVVHGFDHAEFRRLRKAGELP
jgi:hypothetical protein